MTQNETTKLNKTLQLYTKGSRVYEVMDYEGDVPLLSNWLGDHNVRGVTAYSEPCIMTKDGWLSLHEGDYILKQGDDGGEIVKPEAFHREYKRFEG